HHDRRRSSQAYAPPICRHIPFFTEPLEHFCVGIFVAGCESSRMEIDYKTIAFQYKGDNYNRRAIATSRSKKPMGYNKRNDAINAITKESIAFAYYELLQSEKSISVTLICKKAGVSRNAYYRNFNSTDEIIIYCLISKWAKYCEANPV